MNACSAARYACISPRASPLLTRPPHAPRPAPLLQQGIGATHVMYCPKGIVGRIIGRMGDTIKQLQRVTGEWCRRGWRECG